MFEKLRKRRRDRIAVRRQAMFDEAAAQSDPSSGPRDDRGARDLPDALGDLNETVRLGSTIGGSGGP
jgi:hypothetical protein